jgi:hypothetical protein
LKNSFLWLIFSIEALFTLRHFILIHWENFLYCEKYCFSMKFSPMRNIYLISWQTFLTEKYSLQLWNIFPFEIYFYPFMKKISFFGNNILYQWEAFLTLWDILFLFSLWKIYFLEKKYSLLNEKHSPLWKIFFSLIKNFLFKEKHYSL